MRFIIYIVIALLVAFGANAQGKKGKNKKAETASTEVQVAEETPAYDPNNIIIEPDTYPMISGGPTDFRVYIAKNMKYPETALNDQVEGKVMVVATIGPDGKVMEAEINTGVRDDLNQEALRLVREMPNWVPATQGGKKVSSKAVVMVPFKLSIAPDEFK